MQKNTLSHPQADSLEERETPPTSVRAIARHLNFSASTVSLALNGRKPTGFVSVATRKQVLEAAKELGYPLERLRTRRPVLERVAVFLHAGPNPLYSGTALHLCRALNQNGVQALTHFTQTEQEAGTTAWNLYQRQEIDGAVFIGSRTQMPRPEIPSVFIGEVPRELPVWQVRIDNEGAARAVGEYLWAQGHRAMAALAPTRRNLAWERRLGGLRAYWQEQGQDVPDSQILRVEDDSHLEAALRESLAGFLAAERCTVGPVTAFFCFNDWFAGMGLKVLRSLGVRVPEDISVVGFDDSIYAELLDPPLTTVHNPFDTLGSLAADLLLEQAETPEREPRVIVTGCRLIARQSAAPPRERLNHESRAI